MPRTYGYPTPSSPAPTPPRCLRERITQLNPLLEGLSRRAPQHRAMCLRLACVSLEALAGNSTSGALLTAASSASSAAAAAAEPGAAAVAAAAAARAAVVARYPFLGVEQDRSAEWRGASIQCSTHDSQMHGVTVAVAVGVGGAV
eukprot:219654-Chlamydomonas_euryale.AAC.1